MFYGEIFSRNKLYKSINVFINNISIEASSAGAQECDCKETSCGFVLTRGNEIYNILIFSLWCRGHSTHNALGIQQKVGRGAT